MTLKEIIKIASNPETMHYIEKIKFEAENMEYKTIYEQEKAKARMKDWAREIQNLI